MNKKKSFRKIPKFILNKIKIFEKSEFVAVAIVYFPKSKIKTDSLKKYGISYKDNKLVIKDKLTPRASTGKYSRINRHGKIVIRRDLPKITKTFSMEVPNYGDWSKGSHEVEWEREVYKRDKIKAKNLSISPEIIADRDEEIVVGFRINEMLNKSDRHLYEKLLFHLNLLQENFGMCDVVSAGEPLEEKKVFKRLSWEVLPPGWWSDKDQVQKLKERLGPRQAQLCIERLKYVESLNPLERYVGQSYLGSRLYYVFVFKKCVLAECPIFGNAVYLLDKDKMASWQEIFALTKKNALKIGATRILHRGNWKERLTKVLS